MVMACLPWRSDKPSFEEWLQPPSWQRDALCAHYPDVNFFVDRGESTVAAKAICRLCPVRAECLDFAVSNGEKFGIWGGTSERERRHLRKIVSSGNAERPPPMSARAATYPGSSLD